MESRLSPFVQELRRYFISFRRSYIWIVGLIVYALLSVYFFYPDYPKIRYIPVFSSLPASYYAYAF